MHSDRLLLGPGPSVPYPEAIEALARPVLGHLDPEYLGVVAGIAERLRAVFRTSNELTLPVSGTGSAGMEACVVSLVEPGETVVVGVNGYFGERLCEVTRRGGADRRRVSQPGGSPRSESLHRHRCGRGLHAEPFRLQVEPLDDVRVVSRQ